MKNQTVFLFIVLVNLLSIVLILSKFGNSLRNADLFSKLNQALNTINDSFQNPKTTSKKTYPRIVEPSAVTTVKPYPTIKPTYTPKPTFTPKSKIEKTYPTIPQNRPATCYRFSIPHLDGSSSTLCYSQTDFNTLQSLSSQLTIARSNLSFEKSVYEMYKRAYDQHPSQMYQDQINKALANIKKYEDQIGEVSLQMYNIEQRGY
jgi:hypothetical protein